MDGKKRSRVVVALGGNALKKPKQRGTLEETLANATETARGLADLMERGFDVVVTHGNGPQVGAIYLQNEIAQSKVEAMPLFVCGAESQGLLGFVLQQSLQNELARRGLVRSVVSLVTQVVVDKDDPAFQNPTKPIGQFYSKEEAMKIHEEKGSAVTEDAGRGWRVVVPSPNPKTLREADAIRTLVDAGTVVIASGGGGIPVVEKDGLLHGTDAVIDKDLASERLAAVVGADMLVILTDVDCVFRGYGTPEAEPIPRASAAQFRSELSRGVYAKGSMGPKIEAAVRFAERTGKCAVIGALDKLCSAIDGRSGTTVVAEQTPLKSLL